jgi:hypothetical protein
MEVQGFTVFAEQMAERVVAAGFLRDDGECGGARGLRERDPLLGRGY